MAEQVDMEVVRRACKVGDTLGVRIRRVTGYNNTHHLVNLLIMIKEVQTIFSYSL